MYLNKTSYRVKTKTNEPSYFPSSLDQTSLIRASMDKKLLQLLVKQWTSLRVIDFYWKIKLKQKLLHVVFNNNVGPSQPIHDIYLVHTIISNKKFGYGDSLWILLGEGGWK